MPLQLHRGIVCSACVALSFLAVAHLSSQLAPVVSAQEKLTAAFGIKYNGKAGPLILYNPIL